MSDLLNRQNKGKKKLLNRGPKVVPEQSFKLEEPATNEAPVSPKLTRKNDPAQITSVRVTKLTRNKLNALVQLGKAENADLLIDLLLTHYIDSTLLEDEAKTMELIVDILQKR